MNGCEASCLSWFLALGKQNSLHHFQAKNINIYFMFTQVLWPTGVFWTLKFSPNSSYPLLGIHPSNNFLIWSAPFYKTSNGLFLKHPPSFLWYKEQSKRKIHFFITSQVGTTVSRLEAAVSSWDGRSFWLITWSHWQERGGGYFIHSPNWDQQGLLSHWVLPHSNEVKHWIFPVNVVSDLSLYWVEKREARQLKEKKEIELQNLAGRYPFWFTPKEKEPLCLNNNFFD